MTMLQRILFLLLAFGGLPASAQLHQDPRDAMDDGTWQGCDASLVVDFADTLLGNLTYRFDPLIAPGNTAPYSNVWSVFDGQTFQEYFVDTLTYTFPFPGEHVVCLTVNATDQFTQAPCSTVTCHFVDILQDASCAELVVDFTIASVSGQEVVFEDLSSFPGGIVQQAWQFGDGSTSIASSPGYTFTTPGPHEVCLSVVGAPPVGCIGRLCQWLYLGPAPVECELLFTPGFVLVQDMGMVGVLDTSITSGMNKSTSWDFGDGSPVEVGRFAIHVYDQPGFYNLCSTVKTWGPLLADTCVNTLCKDVWVEPLLGIEGNAQELDGLLARPIPFSDRLLVGGLPPGLITVEILDVQGRSLYQRAIWTAGETELQLATFVAGVYLLRVSQGDSRGVIRVLKE
jgi:PKD repeat protein